MTNNLQANEKQLSLPTWLVPVSTASQHSHVTSWSARLWLWDRDICAIPCHCFQTESQIPTKSPHVSSCILKVATPSKCWLKRFLKIISILSKVRNFPELLLWHNAKSPVQHSNRRFGTIKTTPMNYSRNLFTVLVNQRWLSKPCVKELKAGS